MELLRAEGVTCRKAGREILRRVCFDLRAGEIVAVIGPNGAGKTTLLGAVAGCEPLAGGRVCVGERPLRGLPDFARICSFMPDEIEPPGEVSVAILLDHAARHGHPAPGLAEHLIDRLCLGDLRSARGGELSRGERRRLSLYAALCTSRPLLVLDEPLGTFDPLQLVGVVELLRERARAGAALLLSIHQMADAEKVADRVLILNRGEVVAFGPLDELRRSAGLAAATLEQLFLALLRAGGRDVAA